MQVTNNKPTFSDTPACVLNDVYEVPMPGDFVEVIDSLDSQAPAGCFGVILGFKHNSKDEYDICFNPIRAPWGGKFNDAQITAAGGTTYPMVPTELLKPTSTVMVKEFLTKTPYIHPVKNVVKVWTIDLCDYDRAGIRSSYIQRYAH
ncbi:hypothetical protein I7Z51_002422 [Vibrio parahaemolyticus]|uniref:hypothetical protein n=1 Tax=Vibrio TaxID=662 RepID=UPI001A909BB0|nr:MULTISPECIES: hypothetical protein [Vibrio]EGQ7973500.1 hypothetical protein [Vibrio parahaemolyticus]MBO0208598.1 hypothetical protein [Vibrio sp. Vb0877]MCR9810939.1 hypothetical protein [Vibrio parahaemolyticus]MDW2323198.1 hypothetical protein [Vibrio sp. 1159]